jgi:hypothetical protein
VTALFTVRAPPVTRRIGGGGHTALLVHAADGDRDRADRERVGFGESDAAGGGAGGERRDVQLKVVGGGTEADTGEEAQAGGDDVDGAVCVEVGDRAGRGSE